MKLSFILPVLNEGACIASCLEPLQELRQRGHEIIVVDGGSQDNTREQAMPLADKLLTAEPGRAKQMNLGVAQATGEVYVFLHADTLAPAGVDCILLEHLKAGPCWGRFDIRLTGQRPVFRLIETLINYRSRLTGVATGDQGIFVSASLYKHINGFPDIPLMEDIAICQRLKKYGRPVCIKARLVTSSRRWEEHGILRTVLMMWKLRLQYYSGVNPEKLAQQYE